MGTIKRVSKVATVKPKPADAPSLESLVESAASSLHAFVALQRMVEDAVESKTITQNLMCLHAVAITTLSKIKKIEEGMSEKMFSIRDAGGTIEAGPLRPVFNETERRTPKWKDEAIGQATTVAKLKGVPFSMDAYVEMIQAGATPSVSKSFRVVKDEGKPTLQD